MPRLTSTLRLCLATLLLALVGCASTSGGNRLDPFEATNRKVDAFNESVDQAVLKPVAKSYKDYTPDLLQTTVKNFFGNLRDMRVCRWWSLVWAWRGTSATVLPSLSISSRRGLEPASPSR